nr:immunoglobulin heavy chain junction region [Macaca mulatta]MOX37924.1 immunoglobulin heavy chain junction region [Macaca mulatta]MOX38122.1 immunoglobulin heavy chain junction region [Macaca mulatta]MOX38128.1 immunoglobulin heavy chain junction region [Macaca mulatta]MOX38150.1 immunoglobulin heavy chain junction region [Macaca mulatta]
CARHPYNWNQYYFDFW